MEKPIKRTVAELLQARDVGIIFNGVTMELIYANIYDEDQTHIIKRLGYFQPDWVGSQDTQEFLRGSSSVCKRSK